MTFQMPAIENAADAKMASAALLAAVAVGSLTPSEAAEVGKLVDAYLKAIEVTEVLAGKIGAKTMNRSIETRLRRLEDGAPVELPRRRSHVVGLEGLETGQDREAAKAAAKAELIASGAADPDDFFWFLLPLESDSPSA